MYNFDGDIKVQALRGFGKLLGDYIIVSYKCDARTGKKEVQVNYYHSYEDAKWAQECVEYDLHRDYVEGILSEYDVKYYGGV